MWPALYKNENVTWVRFILVINQLDASGVITPIGVMTPDAVLYNFDLLTMST